MLGSGGESDSSEEIHYGPGFVSRLKSRYMSVALRGSARGSLGALRRSASLEDFLDIDRNRAEEEVELQHPEVLTTFSRHSAPVATQPPAAKVRVVVEVEVEVWCGVQRWVEECRGERCGFPRPWVGGAELHSSLAVPHLTRESGQTRQPGRVVQAQGAMDQIAIFLLFRKVFNLWTFMYVSIFCAQ